MSPRSRHPRNAALPAGLRVRNGLYSYTSPIDGREKGLGRDRIKAIQWARAANVEVQRLRGEVSAAEWVRGTPSKSWTAWMDRFQEILDERDSAKATRAFQRVMVKRARAEWPGQTSIASIDTAMVAEALRKLTMVGKRRMAQSYRSFLANCFRCAIAQGWRMDNPVGVTDAVRVKTKRARLSLEHFKTIYADPVLKPWLRNAIALALVSGQRREDIARAQRRDIRDGCWWVEQRKTGARVAIPLSIRMDALAMSLGEVLEQCRGTGILSPYLIHQTYRGGSAKPGAAIALKAFSNEFTAAVRRLGLDWGNRSPPTFHELRSLSKRLYDSQGGVNTKELLGHRSASTAAMYADARGEWVKVSLKATTG